MQADPLSSRTLQSRYQSMQGIWVRWRRRLVIFLTGQLSVQVLTFLTGLLLLRWLTEDEFAKTGVVLGFQITFAALVDLGMGGALVALIGPRGSDTRVVGAYVAAARWWRRVLLAAVLPLGAVVFWFILARQGWSASEGVLLFACLAASLYFAGMAAWSSAPLLIHQRLGTLYAVSNAGSVTRLAGCWLLNEAGRLDAVSVTVLGAAISAASAWAYQRAARRHIVEPERSDPAVRQELSRYVAPLIPLIVFYAVQGQLGTFLSAWFGQAQNVAEVTALGRLGQLFAFLSALFAMLVMPYFANLHDGVFRRRYVWAVSLTLITTAVISMFGFVVPEPLLWLLGARYDHLVREVGWVVLSGALSFAGGAVWAIHSARRWVFWRCTAAYIAAVMLVQVAFAVWVDLGVTLNVIWMGVAANGVGLLCQGLVAWLGLQGHAERSVTPQ